MNLRVILVGLALMLAAVAAFATPPVGQASGYHRMADERTFAGIPNALNVLSNLPFAVVGLLGLAILSDSRLASTDRAPYYALFGAVLLTSIGSSYYHLAPDNDRLVWDRLPMTVGFMGLLTAVIAERVSERLGRLLLMPLIVAGLASVFYWYWTELRGAGDLRPYALVQYGSLLLVAVTLLFYRRSHDGTRYLLAGLAIYALSKALELADAAIFASTRIVSGHTLKHLAAAAGVWCIALMLRQRVEGKKELGVKSKELGARSW